MLTDKMAHSAVGPTPHPSVGGVIIRKSGLLWFFFFRTEPMLSRVITLPNRVGSPKGSLSSSLCLRCAFLCILQSMQLRHLWCLGKWVREWSIGIASEGSPPRWYTTIDNHSAVSGEPASGDPFGPVFAKLRWILCCIDCSELIFTLLLSNQCLLFYAGPGAFHSSGFATDCTCEEEIICTRKHECWFLVTPSED